VLYSTLQGDVSDDLLARIDKYIEGLAAESDPALSANVAEALAARLPAIQVSPNQGRFLYLLAKMSGARRVLEIGTLAGYSTTWLARALPDDGRITSLEVDQTHADVAQRNLVRAGVAARVSIRVARAADSMRRLIDEQSPPFDFIFIDADKPGYLTYLELALQLSRCGTVIVADNVIRNGAVMEDSPVDDNARAVRAFNATVAAHPRLDSIIVPIMRKTIDGMSIAIVR
jgi:predicted O-methyltransferase YrrM